MNQANNGPNSGDAAELMGLLATAMEMANDERQAWLDALPDTQRRAVNRLLVLAEDTESEVKVKDTIDHLMHSVLTAKPAADSVPRWRLLEAIGHGGMAEVFRAQRSDGVVRQEAAVKILWPGMMSPTVQTRFELEREILAKLTHPNIARMLDGGVADDGRPWLATELVDGVPIDEYCTRENLSLEQRLRLFETVAAAVAHAHRQLVVHRDIKPANILVDDEGQARLLDFGIAKRLATEGSGALTGEADRFLTPDYSSPEQLEGAQVDTRSDVFQLGILLYQLIWGTHPLIDDGMSNTQRQQAIVCAQPPRYAPRSTGPSGVRDRLPKEIHAIVTKALAQHPDHRYGSVEQLVDDLRNYRAGLPVSARAPGLLYRLYKFINRHRSASALAAALLVAVIGYSLLVSVQSRRLAEESALNRVVGDFMEALLKEGPMNSGDSPSRSVPSLIDEAVARATSELADQPVAQARVLNLLASIFLADKVLEVTFTQVPKAAALAYQSRPMEEHLAAVLTLARAANLSGSHEEAAALLRGALAVLPPEAPKAVSARIMLADVYHSLGRYSMAKAAFEPLMNQVGSHVLISQTAGMIDRELGRYDESEQSLLMAAQLGREDDLANLPEYAMSFEHLGQLYLLNGDLMAAEASLDRAVALRQKYGSSHNWTQHWLGTLSFAQGRLGNSERILRRTVEDYARIVTTGSQLYGYANSDLGWTLLAQNKLAEAESAFMLAEKVLREGQSGLHFRLSEPLLGRGIIAAARGDQSLAREHIRQALDIRTRLVAPTSSLARNICWVYHQVEGECESAAPPGPGIDGMRARLIEPYRQ
ncbi:MAG: protein kinase [Xanthomonadales bacterium]|nr:protein kinase [Xanthomonadales bacterium]